MRVLFLLPHLSATSGGMARSTYDLLPALRAVGVQPSVVCLQDKQPTLRGEFEKQEIEVTVLPRDAKARIWTLRRMLLSQHIDVLHTGRGPSVIGRLACLGLPIPVVTSIVNISNPRLRGKFEVAYQWTHRLTDRFHAVSFAAKSYAIHELRIPEQRITVIERGRDLARLGLPGTERRLRARAALGIDPRTPVILTVGRQEPAKDQATLVAAFDRLAWVNPHVLLLIAGREGKSTSLLLRHLEHSPYRDRIGVLGHRDDVPELMAAADVFAISSRSEGFSGVVIKAMALELPIVASDLPSLREAVIEGVTGVFACIGDASAFAQALDGMLQDPERARSLGANGRRRFSERFTIERSAERMRDLYEQLVAAHVRVSARAFR